jgi:cysteine-rich repeat protein
VCGNGVEETGEECDDGNEDNIDACTTACLDARCGDGFSWEGVEECDDGNTNDADACRNDCTWAPAVCGDNVRQFGETCDDGNVLDGDACPSDCQIALCTATGTRQQVSVNYAPSVSVGGLVLLLGYPDGRVGIPGLGNATSVRGRISNLQTGYTHVANDLDYALREVLAPQVQGSSLNPALNVFRVSFDLCFGATPPVAGDFACLVESASTPQGLAINLGQNPVTCSVTVP